jgi:hypothetical protein
MDFIIREALGRQVVEPGEKATQKDEAEQGTEEPTPRLGPAPQRQGGELSKLWSAWYVHGGRGFYYVPPKDPIRRPFTP